MAIVWSTNTIFFPSGDQLILYRKPGPKEVTTLPAPGFWRSAMTS